jgi:penicillin-binding protein 1A
VTTTLDTRLQASAENAVVRVLDRSGARRRASQAAVLALDETGGIVAMVGGRSYADSKFNRVTQAQRQPGSSFKAVVYAAALEAGARPEQIYIDAPINMRVGRDMWSPGNYYPGYRGAMSLRTAFENSVNTIAVTLVQQVGAQRVARLGQRLGIAREMQAVPSIALGSEWATPLEMATVFSVFANEGSLFRPYMVTKIENTKGEALYVRPSFEPSRVYDPSLARTMNTLLRGAVLYGTGRSAAPNGVEVAGKTGTTQDWRDAWFVGFSSLYTTAVWVGNDDFSPMSEVTGGSLPAEIWRDFMGFAHTGEEPAADIPLAVAADIGPRQRDLGTYYTNLALAFSRAERIN